MMNDNKIIPLGNMFGYKKGGNFAGAVYDPKGIAPTINTAGGGLRMPIVIEVEDDRDTREDNKD